MGPGRLHFPRECEGSPAPPPFPLLLSPVFPTHLPLPSQELGMGREESALGQVVEVGLDFHPDHSTF